MALTRRTALALSGAVAGTVAAASLAGALVIGGADGQEPTPPDPIAVVDATAEAPASVPTTAPGVEVVYQDVYDLPPATAPAGSAGAVGLSPAPTAPVAAGDLSSTVAGDDGWDDDEYEDEGYEDDGYEDEYSDDHGDDDHEDEDEGEWEDD
ncbi:MAG TPA: hypothetical protein VFU14_03570 [Acidimicrobiales bacterium]|nr:hypothetical protein [Acidimicrobiales bacterium]